MITTVLFMLNILNIFGSNSGDVEKYERSKAQNSEKTVYRFTMDDINGNPVSLSTFKGKVLVIVNVASKCGLTPQYKEIQKFYEDYKDKGVVVLGFPANNFLGQEPGSNEQIREFCEKEYAVTFPMFSKISVKGKDISPLYKFLTDKEENGVMDASVKWNFQKFIIDKQGRMVTFFEPRTHVNEEKFLEVIDQIVGG
jgi:glutathione peroxidase